MVDSGCLESSYPEIIGIGGSNPPLSSKIYEQGVGKQHESPLEANSLDSLVGERELAAGDGV